MCLLEGTSHERDGKLMKKKRVWVEGVDPSLQLFLPSSSRFLRSVGMLGLAHAVLCCDVLIGGQPFRWLPVQAAVLFERSVCRVPIAGE